MGIFDAILRASSSLSSLAADGLLLPNRLTDGEIYEPVTCTACGRDHLVNPKSDKVLEAAQK